MTDKPTPTDAELNTILCAHWPAFAMQSTLVKIWVRDALQDAIDKWGQPAKAVEREQERIAFKDAHRHLELYEVPDAWGRPMFKHSHVEASWLGWIARASRGQAPAGATEPTEQQILEAAEKAGLWPNTVHSWIPAFHRYHKELAKAQPAPAQADSVLYDPKAVLEIFNSARAGSDKPVGYLRGILAVIAHWESRPEPHRWLVPAQPESAQEDVGRHFFDAGWKACANFCDRDDVRFDGIVGHRGCPQFEEAFRAARKQGEKP